VEEREGRREKKGREKRIRNGQGQVEHYFFLVGVPVLTEAGPEITFFPPLLLLPPALPPSSSASGFLKENVPY
jgi:hypothetical protein